MYFARSQRRVRASLFLSVAGLGLALTVTNGAQAQTLRASDLVDTSPETFRISDLGELPQSGSTPALPSAAAPAAQISAVPPPPSGGYHMANGQRTTES